MRRGFSTLVLFIHCEVVDKRETGLKSPNMELLALERALDYLQKTSGVAIQELATDASIIVMAFMGEVFFYSSSIFAHSLHYSKNYVHASIQPANIRRYSILLMYGTKPKNW